MRKIQLLLIIMLSFGFVAGVHAQKKSKEERAAEKAAEKEWKKKLKDLEPAQLRTLIEEKDALVKDKADLNSRVVELETQLSDRAAEVDKVKAQLQESDKRAAEAVASAKSDVGAPLNSKGVVFKVQVGAFKNKDLTKYFQNNKNFSGEVDSDGTKKYTLGFFGDYWEAENFKKYLREMGVKDAWIVAYKNGTRVELKDVLENATSVSSK